MKVCDDVSI